MLPAVDHWRTLVPSIPQVNVCIGATSAKACHSVGLPNVFYPEAPGIEGWAECVVEQHKLLSAA